MKEKPLAYDAYQKLADDYAARIDTKPHNAYYDRPAMLAMMPPLDGANVLDCGCGPGAYMQVMLERGAREITGVDASDRMLELATRRLAEHEGRFKLVQADLCAPLDMLNDNSFDFVNAALCLDYIEDWLPFFREVQRVLKPGGKFLFSCGHPHFDAAYFQTENYFSVEYVECVWSGFGTKVNMPGYRRSIEDVFKPVIESGMLLDRVHEPQPTDDFKRADLPRYLKLKHRPGFLCVRLLNR